MILYHGSNMKFDSISLGVSKDKRDFGKGFYMTTEKSQAEQWAEVLNYRQKKDGLFLYELELNNIDQLAVKKFDGISKEWLDFIAKNRIQGGIQHTFDVVQGPVANDKTMDAIGLYLSNTLSTSETLTRLTYMKPNNQVSIHTGKALLNLKIIRRLEWTV
ncbi:hypothetical protein FACS1894130_03070 [Spirochaetia bacterium]|nr:hypothetical protein FACS1894130_03070 [Spirochaetia bacterium]